jgi:hypothetical protein
VFTWTTFTTGNSLAVLLNLHPCIFVSWIALACFVTSALAASLNLPPVSGELNLYVLEAPVDVQASIENYGKDEVLFKRSIEMIGVLDHRMNAKKAWIAHGVSPFHVIGSVHL